MTTKKPLPFVSQAESAAQPATKAPKSIREKVSDLRKAATVKIAATVAAVLPAAGAVVEEREAIATPYGVFYDSEPTRRLVATIAYAEDLKAIADGIKSMSLNREQLKVKLIALRSKREGLPGHSAHDIAERLLVALDDTNADLSRLVREFTVLAEERYSSRGNGSIVCERVPDKDTVTPVVGTGRHYGFTRSTKN